MKMTPKRLEQIKNYQATSTYKFIQELIDEVERLQSYETTTKEKQND